MKVSGSTTLQASRQEVWRALNDPAVLVRTIPGCERLESIGPDSYKMRVAAGVGSIKGVYDGEVHLTDQQEPGSFLMKAQGAGAPGTIGASVQVVLADRPDGGTELSYDADATVGGMIGGVGQRMLTGVSKKMAAEFFGNVDQVLVGVAPAAVPAAEAPSEAAAAAAGRVFTAPAAARPGRLPGGFPAGVVVGAAIALAGAVVGGWLAGRRRS